MKMFYNKITMAVVLAAAVLTGCEKQLELDNPQTIPASGALDSREEINASIVTMYGLLKNVRLYGRDMIALPEALADNGYATNKSGRLLPESNNNFGAHFTGTIWINSYAAINQINLTLEAIPKLNLVPATTPAEIALWNGQLRFLRGLYYFELMKVYAYTPGNTVPSQDRGGVVISPGGFIDLDSFKVFKPARQSIDSVYKYIVADLKVAEINLLNSVTEKSLATKAAAQALLSRVYLYAKDYANSKAYSDSVINSLGVTRFTDQADYIAAWRSAENKETIFQIKFGLNSENPGVNESLQTSFTTLTAPGLTAVTGGFGDLVPTISLLNELGIGLVGGNGSTNFTGANAAIASRTSDVRNLLYEPGTIGRGKSYVECTKYLGKNGFVNLDNVPVLRFSEMYLNRAEAYATPGSPIFNPALALADLQALKSRRYLNYVGSAVEAADLLLLVNTAALYEEIIRQRRIEFAFEGQRFHDLKRLGRDIVKSLPSVAVVQFTDPRILAPILQADVDGNPNLKQNFGY